MAYNNGKTITYKISSLNEFSPKQILSQVYSALAEKGYDPVDQIIGYLLSEDPTYITNHKNARSLICQIDRDELMRELVRSYLGIQKQ